MPTSETLDLPAPATEREARPAFVPQRYAGAIVAVTAALLTALAVVLIDAGSAARAFVGGESRWSKAQKSAMLALVAYAADGDEAHWQTYLEALAVPLGDKRARVALEQPVLDREAVREGFLAGGIDPADIPGMIRLFRWARPLPPVAEAVSVWTEADGLIEELDVRAKALRAAVQRGATPTQRQALLAPVLHLDAALTPLELRFSAVLSDADRTVRRIFIALMVTGAGALSLTVCLWLRHGQRRADAQARALHESEARRARVLHGSCDGYFEWDLARGAVHLSPRFLDMLGHRPGELPATLDAALALQHPDEQPALREALREHRRGGPPLDMELRLRHRDGRWRWFQVRAAVLRTADGDEGWLSGSISDIARRRDAEDALRRREALFRSLWETTLDGVLIVGTDNRIRFANPAVQRILGHDPAALLGQPLSILQPAGAHHAHAAAVQRYLATGERRLDWRATAIDGRHRDGRLIPLEISFCDLELDDDRVFVGLLRDVSERRAAERALSEANEQLEARVAERTHALSLANEQLRDLDRLKSEFVATMSHELRTPLNSVLGFTSLLLDGRSPLTDEQRRQLGHVRAAGRHLLALINDVLDLSRLESGHMALTLAPVDVVELAREAVEQLRPAAQAKGLALHTRLPTSLSVLADRRRLLQVLLNLGSNAIKFTPSGEVRLFAEAGDAHDPQVRLGVEDTGIGIAPEHLDKLFKPFHQVDSSMSRQHEGTGLGLHLSQRLVGLMHGRIDVRSTPGAGSCFTVWLPAAPLDAAAGE